MLVKFEGIKDLFSTGCGMTRSIYRDTVVSSFVSICDADAGKAEEADEQPDDEDDAEGCGTASEQESDTDDSDEEVGA